MPEGAIIITSINGITDAVAEFCSFTDWDVILVGDTSTPDVDDSRFENLTFLSVEEQDAMDSVLADELPYGHYTRKNMGYLYAIRNGYSVIAESDDDNHPYEAWDEWVSSTFDSEVITAPTKPNVYQEFTEDHVWPRGFSLSEVRNDSEHLKQQREMDIRDVGVVQGLVDEDPDVDAIYRLTIGEPVTFEDRLPVTIDTGVYSPFNSQNTYWPNPEAFTYLYMPATVSIRLTDILRGYVAQRGIWEQDRHLVYRSSSVNQDRNEHDFMVDFEDEIPVYTQVDDIISLLDGLQLTEDAHENLRLMYEALYEAQVVSGEELDLVDAWLRDIER